MHNHLLQFSQSMIYIWARRRWENRVWVPVFGGEEEQKKKKKKVITDLSSPFFWIEMDGKIDGYSKV